MSVELYGPLASGSTISKDGIEQFVDELETLREINKRLFYEIVIKKLLNVTNVPNSIIGRVTSKLNTSINIGDSANDFQRLNIQSGDTITNLTDESSATIVSVVDSNNLITTTLSGGDDNTWQTGDEWQVITSISTNNQRHALVTDVTNSDSLITKVMETSAIEYLKKGKLPRTTHAENVLLRETEDGSEKETKIQDLLDALRLIQSIID